jgi:hypothetical protein
MDVSSPGSRERRRRTRKFHHGAEAAFDAVVQFVARLQLRQAIPDGQGFQVLEQDFCQGLAGRVAGILILRTRHPGFETRRVPFCPSRGQGALKRSLMPGATAGSQLLADPGKILGLEKGAILQVAHAVVVHQGADAFINFLILLLEPRDRAISWWRSSWLRAAAAARTLSQVSRPGGISIGGWGSIADEGPGMVAAEAGGDVNAGSTGQ